MTLRSGEAAATVAAAFFGPLGARMDELLAGYRPDELAVARRFLVDTIEMVRAHREAVRAEHD